MQLNVFCFNFFFFSSDFEFFFPKSFKSFLICLYITLSQKVFWKTVSYKTISYFFEIMNKKNFNFAILDMRFFKDLMWSDDMLMYNYVEKYNTDLFCFFNIGKCKIKNSKKMVCFLKVECRIQGVWNRENALVLCIKIDRYIFFFKNNLYS